MARLLSLSPERLARQPSSPSSPGTGRSGAGRLPAAPEVGLWPVSRSAGSTVGRTAQGSPSRARAASSLERSPLRARDLQRYTSSEVGPTLDPELTSELRKRAAVIGRSSGRARGLQGYTLDSGSSLSRARELQGGHASSPSRARELQGGHASYIGSSPSRVRELPSYASSPSRARELQGGHASDIGSSPSRARELPSHACSPSRARELQGGHASDLGRSPSRNRELPSHGKDFGSSPSRARKLQDNFSDFEAAPGKDRDVQPFESDSGDRSSRPGELQSNASDFGGSPSRASKLQDHASDVRGSARQTWEPQGCALEFGGIPSTARELQSYTSDLSASPSGTRSVKGDASDPKGSLLHSCAASSPSRAGKLQRYKETAASAPKTSAVASHSSEYRLREEAVKLVAHQLESSELLVRDHRDRALEIRALADQRGRELQRETLKLFDEEHKLLLEEVKVRTEAVDRDTREEQVLAKARQDLAQAQEELQAQYTQMKKQLCIASSAEPAKSRVERFQAFADAAEFAHAPQNLSEMLGDAVIRWPLMLAEALRAAALQLAATASFCDEKRLPAQLWAAPGSGPTALEAAAMAMAEGLLDLHGHALLLPRGTPGSKRFERLTEALVHGHSEEAQLEKELQEMRAREQQLTMELAVAKRRRRAVETEQVSINRFAAREA